MVLMQNKYMSHRAGHLHPGLAIDLHGKCLLRLDDHLAALGQAASRGSEPSSHLPHVQAVLQANHLDQAISNI